MACCREALIVEDSSNGQPSRSEKAGPGGGFPKPGPASASLVIQRQIIQESEAKLDRGTAKGRGKLDVSTKVTLPSSAQTATAARTRRRGSRATKLRAGASPVLERLVKRLLQGFPRREAREDQTARLLRRLLHRL